MSISHKGFLVLLCSVVLNAAAYHFARVGIRAASAATHVAVSCFVVSIEFLLVAWFCRNVWPRRGRLSDVTLPSLLRSIRLDWRRAGAAAVIGATGGWLIAQTIGRFGSETAAFLGNMTFCYLILAGIIMGDRLRLAEVVAVAAIVAGAFLFSYTGGEIKWLALGMMGAACLCTACKQLIAKGLVARGNTFIAVSVISLFMAAWGVILGAATGTLVMPSPRALLFMVLAGTSGSMIGMSLLYTGYVLVGVSRGAPLDAMRPLAVLVIGLALGTALPGPVQLLGGAMVLIGSAVLGWLMGRSKESHEDPVGNEESSYAA